MTHVGHNDLHLTACGMQRNSPPAHSTRRTCLTALRWYFAGMVLFAATPGQAGEENAETPESGAAVASEETAATDIKPETIALPYRYKPRMDARLRLEYEYRKQGSYEDNDFYGRLYMNGRNYWNGKLDLYTSMRLYHDFDEPVVNSMADDPYYSLSDSEETTEDRILQLYADAHTQNRRLALRAGRQYVDIADYMQIDGAQLMLTENEAIGGRLYAGHPVSYYSSVSGDFAGGLSLIGKPWEENQTRFTIANYHDDSVDETDINYFLDTRQRWSETTRTRGRFSFLNDEYHMAQADMFYLSEDGETDFSIGANYWGAFDAKTRAYSPLYEVMGELDPYAYTYARLVQQVAQQWFISPGLSLRFADDRENEFNNRDYQNYDVAFIYQPNRSLSASVSVEYWSVEDADSFAGLSGEIRYRNGRIWEVSGGASYAEYTYDTYSDLSYTAAGGQTQFTETGTVIEESPYVKTYFIRGKWMVIKRLVLRSQFDIEDNDLTSDLAYRARVSMEVRY